MFNPEYKNFLGLSGCFHSSFSLFYFIQLSNICINDKGLPFFSIGFKFKPKFLDRNYHSFPTKFINIITVTYLLSKEQKTLER